MPHLSKFMVLFACVAAGLCAGCGDAGPLRSATKGTVTIEGLPLKAGRIMFVPVPPNSGPAVSGRIANGKYEFPRSTGPLVGKNRVEVDTELNLGFPLDDEEAFARRGGTALASSLMVPPEFNAHSQFSVEIKSGEVNQYDIAIPAAQSAAYR